MGNMYERIQELCGANGITIGKMCSNIGIRRSILSDFNVGRTKSLSVETISKIAEYFGVSIGFIIGEENKIENLSKAKQDFINEIMDWPDEQIKALTEAARAFKAMYQK